MKRRTFISLLLLVGASFVFWIYRRSDTVSRIQEFLGLDHEELGDVIREQLSIVRTKHPKLYLATTVYFSLPFWFADFVFPGSIRSKVIEYWANELLGNRSRSWKYVHYPPVDDDDICTGLIRIE